MSNREFKYEYYQTNVGFFFRRNATSYYNNLNQVNSINHIPANEIQNLNGWWKLDSPIDIVKFNVLGSRKRVGWKLSDPVTFDKLPSYFEEDQVKPFWSDDDDDGGELKWSTNEKLQSLYEEVYETTEDTTVEAVLLGTELGKFTVSDYSDPSKMEVKTSAKVQYSHEPIEVSLDKIACYEDIEKLLTPEFLLHLRPCALTSQQMFNIIRRYILDNIDRNHATITSNYDFCFDVQKIVNTKPFSESVSVKKGRSWASKTVKSTEKKIPIFRMSYENYKDGKPYNDYPAIEGIKAKNLKELEKKLKEMLDNIVTLINTPVKECECCNGTGWIAKT